MKTAMILVLQGILCLQGKGALPQPNGPQIPTRAKEHGMISTSSKWLAQAVLSFVACVSFGVVAASYREIWWITSSLVVVSLFLGACGAFELYMSIETRKKYSQKGE